MTGHRQIPSKIKPRLFNLCLKKASDKRSLIIEVEIKLYFFRLYGLMTCTKRLQEVFQNSHLGGTDKRSCSFESAEALVKN